MDRKIRETTTLIKTVYARFGRSHIAEAISDNEK